MRGKDLAKSIGVITAVVLLSWSFNPPKGLSGPVPGVTDDTILIGMPAPLAGPYALFSKQAADLPEAVYLEWGKNIHGRSIKLIKEDEGCDPVKAVAAVKKLLYVDKVFLLHGPSCTSSVLAVKPLLAQEGKTPCLTTGALSDLVVNPLVKNLFNPSHSATTYASTMVDFIETIPGAKRVGLIHHTTEWAMSFYTPFIKYLKEKCNVAPVVDVVTEMGVADTTSQVLKLKSANVDVVIATLYISETTAFLRDAYKLGLNVPIIGGTATSATDQYENLKTLEPLKKYFQPYWGRYPLDHPKVKVFEELFKKYHPEKKFDAQTTSGCNAPLIVLEALKKCGRDLTQEKFIDVLETEFQNWEPDNWVASSPVTFSKTDHLGIKKAVMATIATGKFEVVGTYQDYEKLMKK